MRTRWIASALAALTLGALTAPTVFAQGTDRVHARRQPPPVAGEGPTEAPPPPKAEQREAAKAGFAWVDGEWDWKAGKWEWIPGHWERARANKQWTPGRWEQKDGKWTRVRGRWDNAPATPPPTNPPAPAPGQAGGNGDGPREAPPPPRSEQREAAKAGFVWVEGEWDWKNGKYEWIAGHWEKERAGKRWRAGRWEQRDGRWTRQPGAWEDGGPPPSGNDRPREAPPPPRSEQREAAKAGFVWVEGEWDWKNGKYEWIAGHWEKERAGKRWRPGRWEQRDGGWTRTPGDWEDGTAGPGPQRPDRPDRPRREWKLERPVVSNYWPAKGKVGTVITIRGRNFPKDAVVVWAGKEVRGVKVDGDVLRVTVPPDAVTGQLAVRAGRGRDISVGSFEVAASYDPVAEQRRIEDEARKKAEAAWVERQRALSKDRAAREAAYEQRRAEREANREQRRADREREIRSRFAAAFLADLSTQDELTLHAQRSAELQRMAEVAEIKADGKLVVRIEVLRSREDQRHDERMAALEASFRAGGAR